MVAINSSQKRQSENATLQYSKHDFHMNLSQFRKTLLHLVENGKCELLQSFNLLLSFFFICYRCLKEEVEGNKFIIIGFNIFTSWLHD